MVAPLIDYLHPADAKGRDEFCLYLGCQDADLADGEGWGSETLTDLSSHCGTHADAPLHSGSRSAGQPARTIADIALDELSRPGLVLDMRPCAKLGREIIIETLDSAWPQPVSGSRWAMPCSSAMARSATRCRIPSSSDSRA